MNDLTGKHFGRLTVLYPMENRSRQGYIQYMCECSCIDHTKVITTSYRLTSGHTKSCGCLQREITSERNRQGVKYPETDRDTRLFRIWKGMIARTRYDSQEGYSRYGGRGIRVCNEWRDNFHSFRDWSEANGYADGLTIDRLDNDGNYEPSNCMWSTRKEQNNNQRSNIRITYDGNTYNASQWADIMGINRSCIYKRISRGYPVERILQEYIEAQKEIKQ